MSVLQKIRSYIAVDTETAKKEAFQQISMINGVGGAEQLYIPPDMRETNAKTIFDSRGRLVSGEVLPEDYLQGDNNLTYPVLSTFWMVVIMLFSLFLRGNNQIHMGSDLSSVKDIFFSLLNIDLKMAFVLFGVTYLHNKTTEKWFSFLFFSLFQIALISTALASGSLFASIFAFSLPGVRLMYMNWKGKKDRVARIKTLSDNQLGTAGATNSVDANQIKLLALDDSPVVSIAPSNGAFHKNGFSDGVSEGLQLSLSFKDMTKHVFTCGASGEGKSETMKQILDRSVKVNEKKKAELLKKGKKHKDVGWAVFCGKGDFPYDLGLISDGGLLHGIVKPLGFDPILNKITGYKNISLFGGLGPEKVTKNIVGVAGGGSKSKAGENKIFDVSGESLTYRSSVALRFLKTYGSYVGVTGYKWAPAHLYDMYANFVKRKEAKDSNGNNTYINDNDVLIALRKIKNYIEQNLSSLSIYEQELRKNDLKVLELTIKFGENCLNDDIQKFIQSVVATAQSWISSLTENAQLIEWANTDEDESDVDVIQQIMLEGKRFGFAMKSEEFGSGSVLIQNFFIERLLNESAIRGKTWKDPNSNQHQFLLIMDEAQDILKESLVKDYAKKLRNWGASMVIMTQNISTLIDRFGEETINGFLGDIANHIVFNPKDPKTLEYYMKRIGKYRLFKGFASSVPPYDFRQTAETALRKATFDNNNPYSEEYKKLRTNLNFETEKSQNGKNSGKISTNSTNWFSLVFNKIFTSVFGQDDGTNFVTIATYKQDEKVDPVVYAFDEIEQNTLTTKGQALVIVERGIKRRTDLVTMYTPKP